MLILHEGELLHTDSSTATKVTSDKRVRATGRYLKDYRKGY